MLSAPEYLQNREVTRQEWEDAFRLFSGSGFWATEDDPNMEVFRELESERLVTITPDPHKGIGWMYIRAVE